MEIWVILQEQGCSSSWTDLAFWSAAVTYEAAEEKLREVVNRGGVGGFSRGRDPSGDVVVWAGRSTWRIRKVVL